MASESDDPVNSFLEERTKEAAVKAQEDLKLWNEWDSAGRTTEGIQPLMNRYSRLLDNKARQWKAPAVSDAAFKAELQKQFVYAAHTFDPNKQVAFNSWVQRSIKRAQRFNARHQNIGYIPEDKAKLIGPIQVAQNTLIEELGRKPTPAEIGQRAEIPTRQVSQIMKIMRRDVPASKFETDPTALSTSREQEVIRLISRRPEEYLEPREVKVFQHVYGVGGVKKITGTRDLANTLGYSQSTISRVKTSIGEKIKKHI